jgi:HEAT repeat protein
MPDDVMIGGRPVGEWIARLKSEETAARAAAEEALTRLSQAVSEALPALAEALKTDHAASRIQLARLLGEFGGQLMASVPLLRDALRTAVLTAGDPEVRAAASEALVQVGPYARSAVPVLIENLKEDIRAVRWSAAHDLGEIGPEALDALPALTAAALHDSVPRVRVEAAVAIWRIDRRINRVLSPLIGALKDSDELVRWIAADCLGDIGPDAREALPALKAALELPYKTRLIRLGVAAAIDRIDASHAWKEP